MGEIENCKYVFLLFFLSLQGTYEYIDVDAYIYGAKTTPAYYTTGVSGRFYSSASCSANFAPINVNLGNQCCQAAGAKPLERINVYLVRVLSSGQ